VGQAFHTKWAQTGGKVKSKYIETTRPNNVQPIWLQESEGVYR
jgi:hypothetical protein